MTASYVAVRAYFQRCQIVRISFGAWVGAIYPEG